ncbi:MAG TPA: PilZ domain-containing protein [Planctomycetota bacterium]|nr:PilZ domain-containing protein [Planctomycetota bacterium]
MSSERRRHDRVSAKDASVALTSGEFAKKGSDSYNLAVRLLDTSSSGACIVTKGRLREGISVIVGVVLPRQGTKVMSRAVVRWSTTVESKGRTAHVAGLQFERPLSELAPVKPPPTASEVLRSKEPQRRHRRFTPEKVEIICLPRSLLRKLGVKSNSAKSLKNLSLGGAQIVCSQKLSPGDPVDLTLQFRYPATSVTAEGIVRWCRRDTLSLEPRWNVGVVFKQMDSASDGRLKTVEAVFVDENPAP